jgi:hypothetical protein
MAPPHLREITPSIRPVNFPLMRALLTQVMALAARLD